MPRRVPLLLAGTLVVLPAATACSLLDSTPDPEPTAQALAEALRTGEFADVTVPGREWDELGNEWSEALGDLVELDRSTELLDVEQDDEAGTAVATIGWEWQLADDVEPWTYETAAGLTLSGEGDGQEWVVEWDRTLVLPSLAPDETLGLVTLEPERAPILGGDGDPLVTDREVSRIGIDKTRAHPQAALRSARKLAAATGVDVTAFVERVQAAGEKAFVEAVTFRIDEVPTEVIDVLEANPAAVGVRGELPLAPSREFAAEILGRSGEVTAEMVEEAPELYEPGDIAGISGFQSRYDEQLRGLPGLAVRAENADGEVRDVHTVDATPGEPLRLTLDADLQYAAEQALAGFTDTGSALVAVRPSSGEILAAANGPGNGGLNLATFGQFAPGSTFKIVSSLALLRSGADPETTLECTGSTVVDGKRFGNYSDYPSAFVGTIPLRQAVAHSCNTAFINARDRLQGPALSDAAASLGFGVDHEVGFPAFFGEVEPDRSATGAAAQLIGQGTVLASPMAMAAVIGSVRAGEVVVPWLVETPEADTSAPEGAEPLTAAEAEALRGMLRAVVTDGSGRGLADLPGDPVLAKTGTAEFGTGADLRTHAWMVAAQGDLAVAVFVEVGESGSQTAGPVLEEFLRAAH